MITNYFRMYSLKQKHLILEPHRSRNWNDLVSLVINDLMELIRETNNF